MSVATITRGSLYWDFVTFEVRFVSCLMCALLTRVTEPSTQVEGLVYRVPRYGFEKWSGMFADMFKLPAGPDGTTVEGTTDENPIKPPDCTSLEFVSLLKVMYPQYVEPVHES